MSLSITLHMPAAYGQIIRDAAAESNVSLHAMGNAILMDWVEQNGAQRLNGAQALDLATKWMFRSGVVRLDTDKLRSHRESLGQSMHQFADSMGMHYQAYQRLEAGNRPRPSLDTIARIARRLGVTIDSLLTDVSPLPVPAPQSQP